MCIMDNGNDPPACIPFLEISDENMIPTNSGLIIITSCIHGQVYGMATYRRFASSGVVRRNS